MEYFFLSWHDRHDIAPGGVVGVHMGELQQGRDNDVSRAAVVQLNFRAGTTFPVPVCTVPCSIDRTSRYNKVDAVRGFI